MKRNLWTTNSGIEYAESRNVARVQKCVNLVRSVQIPDGDVVYGKSFISVKTPLIGQDLSARPDVRTKLESIGRLSVPNTSDFVYVDIGRSYHLPLWVSALAYFVLALFNLWCVYAYLDHVHAMVTLYRYIYFSN